MAKVKSNATFVNVMGKHGKKQTAAWEAVLKAREAVRKAEQAYISTWSQAEIQSFYDIAARDGIVEGTTPKWGFMYGPGVQFVAGGSQPRKSIKL